MVYSKETFTKIVVTLGLACAFSLSPAKLLAEPISWTIAGNTSLAGGANVEGSFVYDAALNSFTDIDVVVGDDDNPLYYDAEVPGDTYTSADFVGGSASELELYDAAANTGLNLFFGYWTPDLTDEDATIAMGLNLLIDGDNVADVESPGSIPYNALISSTPEPQTAFLMLAGILAGLAAKRWSSRSSSHRLLQVDPDSLR